MSTSSTRPLSIGYLVVGLVFVGLAGTWLLHQTGVIDPDGLQWLLPAILLGAGLTGLFASLGKGLAGNLRKPRPGPQPQPEPEPVLPTLDLTSDLDRKLAEQTTGQQTTGEQSTGEHVTGEHVIGEGADSREDPV